MEECQDVENLEGYATTYEAYFLPHVPDMKEFVYTVIDIS